MSFPGCGPVILRPLRLFKLPIWIFVKAIAEFGPLYRSNSEASKLTEITQISGQFP